MRTVEYLRVLPDRVLELEAQGWHPAVASSFSNGHGFEVVMVREIAEGSTTPEEGT